MSESCLRNWLHQADVDDDAKERSELVRLRRELRVMDMEIKIQERASALFARENVLPKSCSGWSTN